jgi:hypothetical protein
MGTRDKRFQSTSLFTDTSFAMQAETSESHCYSPGKLPILTGNQLIKYLHTN